LYGINKYKIIFITFKSIAVAISGKIGIVIIINIFIVLLLIYYYYMIVIMQFWREIFGAEIVSISILTEDEAG
jgi:hypothetical protein